MAKMEFDTVDAALVVTGLASAFMLVGIATFQLFGVDFGATQFTLSRDRPLDRVAARLWIDRRDHPDERQHRVAVALGRHSGATGLVHVRRRGDAHSPRRVHRLPDTVGSFFQSSDLWGLLYVVGVTAGQFALGWML